MILGALRSQSWPQQQAEWICAGFEKHEGAMTMLREDVWPALCAIAQSSPQMPAQAASHMRALAGACQACLRLLLMDSLIQMGSMMTCLQGARRAAVCIAHPHAILRAFQQ